MRGGWGAIAHSHVGGRRGTPQHHPAFGALHRLDGLNLWRRFSGGNGSELQLDLLEQLFGVEVAAGDYDRIVRCVIAPVMPIKLIAGDAAEIAFIADDRMTIWVMVKD